MNLYVTVINCPSLCKHGTLSKDSQLRVAVAFTTAVVCLCSHLTPTHTRGRWGDLTYRRKIGASAKKLLKQLTMAPWHPGFTKAMRYSGPSPNEAITLVCDTFQCANIQSMKWDSSFILGLEARNKKLKLQLIISDAPVRRFASAFLEVSVTRTGIIYILHCQRGFPPMACQVAKGWNPSSGKSNKSECRVAPPAASKSFHSCEKGQFITRKIMIQRWMKKHVQPSNPSFPWCNKKSSVRSFKRPLVKPEKPLGADTAPVYCKVTSPK